MGFLYYIVLTIHVIVTLFLILVVLLQSGRSGDLATAFGGGGGSQSVFGPRGTTNVLTKATTYSAITFILTTCMLVYLSQNRSGSRLKASEAPASGPVSTAPAATPPAPNAPNSTAPESSLPTTPQGSDKDAPPAGSAPPAGQ